MKNYVTFSEVVSAIIGEKDITIKGKNVSFYQTDTIIKGYAAIYSDIADMSGVERNKIISKHKFHVYRIIRSITTELLQITKTDGATEWDTADKYTRIVKDLLCMGIAPTPDIFNIMRNTSVGMLFESCSNAGEKALETIMNKSDRYNEILDTDFFEEYIAIENMHTAPKINALLNTALPTNLYRWLSRYVWSDYECEYINDNFTAFINRYEREVLSND